MTENGGGGGREAGRWAVGVEVKIGGKEGERAAKGRGGARSKGRWRRLNRIAMGHQWTAEKAGFLR